MNTCFDSFPEMYFSTCFAFHDDNFISDDTE